MDLVGRLVTTGDRAVLQLQGEIDLSTLPALHDHLSRAATDDRSATLYVDLDGVTSLDDAGLGVLLGWAGRRREAGGDLELVCTSRRLLDRFGLTGLSRAVTVRDRLPA